MSVTEIIACILMLSSALPITNGEPPPNSQWTGDGGLTNSCPYECNPGYVKNTAGSCVWAVSTSSMPVSTARPPSTPVSTASPPSTPVSTATPKQTTSVTTPSPPVTSPGTTTSPSTGISVKFSMTVPISPSYTNADLQTGLWYYQEQLGSILNINANRISVTGNVIPFSGGKASIQFTVAANSENEALALQSTILSSNFKNDWTPRLGSSDITIFAPSIQGITTTSGKPQTTTNAPPPTTNPPQQTTAATGPQTTATPQPGTYVNFDLQITPTTTVTQASLDGIIQIYKASLSDLLTIPIDRITVTAKIVTNARRRRLLANSVILSASILAPTSGAITAASILSNVQSPSFSTALQTSTSIPTTVNTNSIQVQTVTTPAPAPATTQPAAPPAPATTIAATTTTAASSPSSSSDNTLLIVAIAVPAGIVVIIIIVVIVCCSISSSRAKGAQPQPNAASAPGGQATQNASRFKAFRVIPLKAQATPQVQARLVLKMNP